MINCGSAGAAMSTPIRLGASAPTSSKPFMQPVDQPFKSLDKQRYKNIYEKDITMTLDTETNEMTTIHNGVTFVINQELDEDLKNMYGLDINNYVEKMLHRINYTTESQVNVSVLYEPYVTDDILAVTTITLRKRTT